MRAGLVDYVLQQAPQPPHPRTRPQQFRLPQGPDRGSAVLAAARGPQVRSRRGEDRTRSDRLKR
ncbi:hypothetical protein [Streptomyces sp. enrichment culture]|uniref:hypothetical protein n=1 Tax=Streptomyces sp. enrichment culture TaxID=1795815 RepID=UPI003F563715